ncbi:outer membrane beta-barrel protein [Vibrio coralliilyticus]|uniref:outer membrane beta-barrel protein n=1 Tax=Vibrio coralliilyticus TaxID=190893 RepID=UPI0017FFCDA3|nr:outer membrane beta-barrel protein [Vibrio coralliilyticus]NUW70078.1 outer membrane beta-barrel protein [Vibrio coralliilyticus]
MRKYPNAILSTFLLLTTSTFASAESHSFLFVTGKVSNSEYEPTSDSEPNYGIEVGSELLPIFNTEVVVGYSNLGEYTVGNSTLKMGSFHAAIGPKFDIGLFNINFKVGGHKWKSELGQIEEDGLDPYYSAGFGVKVPGMEFIELGIAYSMYQKADQGRDDRENISGNVTLHLF